MSESDIEKAAKVEEGKNILRKIVGGGMYHCDCCTYLYFSFSLPIHERTPIPLRSFSHPFPQHHTTVGFGSVFGVLNGMAQGTSMPRYAVTGGLTFGTATGIYFCE